jgi:hypothetical protein
MIIQAFTLKTGMWQKNENMKSEKRKKRLMSLNIGISGWSKPEPSC